MLISVFHIMAFYKHGPKIIWHHLHQEMVPTSPDLLSGWECVAVPTNREKKKHHWMIFEISLEKIMQLLLGPLRMLLEPSHHAVRKPNPIHIERLSGNISGVRERCGAGCWGEEGGLDSSQLLQTSLHSYFSLPTYLHHYSKFNHCLTASPWEILAR